MKGQRRKEVMTRGWRKMRREEETRREGRRGGWRRREGRIGGERKIRGMKRRKEG